MLEKHKAQVKDQIIEISDELIKTKKMPPERVNELVLKTQEIAKKLDDEKGLDGVFDGRVTSIYYKSETKHPKKRLNLVVGLLVEKAGLTEEVERLKRCK